MEELQKLDRAVKSFSKNIADFPVGAISLHDLKSTDEKIQDLRNSLKGLNARVLMLKAKTEAQKMTVSFEESVEETFDNLQDKITCCIINKKGLETCLQKTVTNDIFDTCNESEMQSDIKGIMLKVYTLNDIIIRLHQERAEQLDKEATLTKELQEELHNFSDFLKQQEDTRKKKLQETNPEIASNKEMMQKRLQRINIMKRLITNFIGSSGHMIKRNPLLREIIRNHRELIDIEAIANMSTDKGADES